MNVLLTEIYQRVKDGKPMLRPTLLEPTDDEDYSEELLNMIRRCWSEYPVERPEFHSLKSITKRINKYTSMRLASAFAVFYICNDMFQ